MQVCLLLSSRAVGWLGVLLGSSAIGQRRSLAPSAACRRWLALALIAIAALMCSQARRADAQFMNVSSATVGSSCNAILAAKSTESTSTSCASRVWTVRPRGPVMRVTMMLAG